MTEIPITKTRLFKCIEHFTTHRENLTPVNPLLYNKTGVYRGIHYSSYFAKIIDCGFSLEPPAVLTITHNLRFEQEYEKYQNFLSENFPCLIVKFSEYLNRCVFVMKKGKFSDKKNSDIFFIFLLKA